MSHSILRSARKLGRTLLGALRLRGYRPRYDLAGYDSIIAFLEKQATWEVPGDVLEVGAFMGGGTRSLGSWASKYGKRILAVDIFDIVADTTETTDGCKMQDIYAEALHDRDLLSLFQKNTASLRNLVIIRQDSKLVRLDPTQTLCFAFIDGNHNHEYVWNDFRLAWRHLSAGGWIGFHDYDHDLPSVTTAIHEILTTHSQQIRKILRIENRSMLFLQKETAADQSYSYGECFYSNSKMSTP